MRGTLLRGSKMCQRPPIQASNHAAKSPGGIRRRRSDIAQVAGAVSRRNIHAAAEGDGQMRVVAANAGPFAESLRGAAGGAGVLVVEGNMVMNVIADCLHARVPGSRAAEELPGRLETANRSRNSGCPAGTPGSPRADPARSPARQPDTISSGWPLSLMTPSAVRRRRPAGARTRWHRFPKPSR